MGVGVRVAGTAPHQVCSPKSTHSRLCVFFGGTYPRNVLFEGERGGWGGRHSTPPGVVAETNTHSRLCVFWVYISQECVV